MECQIDLAVILQSINHHQMKNIFFIFVVLNLPFASEAQVIDATYIANNYDYAEHFIPMRDGARLFTIVYTPKDKSKKYPFLMNRTCYNASRSADNKVNAPSASLIQAGYILVYQDVRGRYMSEGSFDNMRPNIKGNRKRKKKEIDESSDTYDTVDWLIKNIANNNGRVGQYGISYPGFYTTAALPDAHPALLASSPQAPIADFYFDDFHHHGAFLLSYAGAFAVFGEQKDSLTREAWYTDSINKFYSEKVPDAYEWFLEKGPVKNITEEYYKENFFWEQIITHPDYDSFWQDRNILPHLRGIDHAVLTVGGWYDAEDLYGPLNIYKTIEDNNPKANNTIVMGPWTHGDWARDKKSQTVNHIYYGENISSDFQKDIELPFFEYHLKNNGTLALPEAYVFDTGTKEWNSFSEWPPREIAPVTFYFCDDGELSINQPTNKETAFDYISDPDHPVPHRSEMAGLGFTPRLFITDDQRHASRRPDVITFETEILEENITIAGEILAELIVSMTGTDADFIVKLIDVYPNDHQEYIHNPKNIKMGGYQQLVRHETFRGRYRNSYENPEPFTSGKKTQVQVPLQDILHTFKKGHKIMIQIHSTWFPYIDRNPQKYVPNIFEANEEDFIKSTITVYGASSVKAGGNAIKEKKVLKP